MTARPALFVDLDGVLADFDRHAVEALGLEPAATHPRDFWRAVDQHKGFWDNIPPFSYTAELWAGLAPFDPIILTGLPSTGTKRAERAKRAWVARHLGEEVPVICCWTREKPQHMRAPGDILVDDRASNINDWIAAGGRGMVFDGPLPTLSRIGEIMAPFRPDLARLGDEDPIRIARAQALYGVKLDPETEAWERTFLSGMAALAYSPRPRFSEKQRRQIDRLACKYHRQIDARLVPVRRTEEVVA